MTFTSFNLLARIIATDSLCTRRLDRLAVQDRGTGLRIPAFGFPKFSSQSRVDVCPSPVFTPETELVVDGLPRRQVVRQHAPSTASAYDVEDGIQNFPDGVLTLATSIGFGFGDQRLDFLPFEICQIARVQLSCTVLSGHNGQVYPKGRDPSIFRHALSYRLRFRGVLRLSLLHRIPV